MKNLFRGAGASGPAAAGAAASATARPAAQPFRRESFGFGPPRGSPQQLEMVSSLVQAAMRGAQGSGSPIVSFLAPLLGSAAMGRAASLQGQASQAGISEMGQSLYGRDLTEQELSLFQIANNEDAPGMFREEARRRLERLLAGGGGGGGSAATPSPNPTGGRGRSTPGAPGGVTAADDGVATLADALSAGATPAPSVIAELEATMNDPNSTAQARTHAQRLLTSIFEGVESGDRVAPSAAPATPMLGVTPPSFGAPVTPLAQPNDPTSNRPPPPPGTVPY